jgi:hypothetical protein
MSTLRSKVIRLAGSLPKGTNERRALLEVLAASKFPVTIQFMFNDNFAYHEPDWMAATVAVINDLLRRGVRNPRTDVGELKGGMVDRRRQLLVHTFFEPVDAETLAVAHQKTDSWYTRRKNWPVFVTMFELVTQAKAREPMAHYLDVDWYGVGSQIEKLR